MNLEQMKYMIEIVKEGSITKAAEKLHLSASAISQSISQLEEELGLSLFLRSKKGMKPTKEGTLFISKSYDIVQKIHELHVDLESKKKGAAKELRIACTPTMTYVVFDAFLSLNNLYKDVTFIIEELDQEQILHKIKNEEVDLAFASYPQNELDSSTYENGIGYKFIFTDFLCVCMNKNSSNSKLQTITPKELENEKVVVYNSGYVQNINEKHLINKEFFITSNNVEVLKNAMIYGPAVSLVLNSFLKNTINVNSKELVTVPFKNPNFIFLDFWCLYPLAKGISNVAEAFESKVSELATK
ncbi:LysR family transcriptional regulator [Sutcliffiella horikoshii]|uniref:LysR family transcriptional regulator n=1 Tax=Sutcliffiella horikoshii TaxID=79883 RepID=A0A5D4SUX8_9BACI|nr:LysR family transcriptional regulator [Sutcliffiella horikoshii]TYS67183.1 LysR family transcriptional regulator [Sutcliffiella horikoshii]